MSKPGHSLLEYALVTVQTPASWVGAVAALVVRAITPTPELGAAIFGLVGLWLIDLALGVLVAWKDEVPITSKRIGDSFGKLGAYLALPVAFGFMKLVAGYSDHGFWAWATWAVVGVCAGREAWSIVENSGKLGVNLGPKLTRAIKGRIASLGDPAEEKKENGS